MNALPSIPYILPSFAESNVGASGGSGDLLVQMDQVVEFIGDDPETQLQVFALSLDLINSGLPQMRQAMANGDHAVIQRIAHRARGSLGMLGVPNLQELSNEIEYNCVELGEMGWRKRCERLCEMFTALRRELEERLAA